MAQGVFRVKKRPKSVLKKGDQHILKWRAKLAKAQEKQYSVMPYNIDYDRLVATISPILFSELIILS